MSGSGVVGWAAAGLVLLLSGVVAFCCSAGSCVAIFCYFAELCPGCVLLVVCVWVG